MRTDDDAELAAVAAVGAAAGELFRTIDDPRIARCADDPPYSLEELRPWVGLVAVGGDGTIVGFLLLEVVDGCAHVEEVSVHPGAQGGGVGTALLEAAATWAAAEGLPAVTLTTFRDVPWNRPFYERRGYRVLGDDEVGPELVAKIAEEAAHGLEPSIRVAMRRAVRPS
jgi:GNAT superfamily N-acetyltransferase